MAPQNTDSPLPGEMPGKSGPLLNRTLIIFLTGMILANIASRMNNPMIPLYVQSLGASVQQVGFFFTITSVAPLAFQILGGFVSDSIGRLQAIAIGSIAGIVGYVLYITAPSWQWLILAQGISSLASCFVAPSFQAFIAEQSTEETRARVFATVESIYMVVGVVGPPIGGMVSQKHGYRAMFAVAGVFYGLATIIRVLMARRAGHQVGVSTRDGFSLASLKQSLGQMASLVLAGGVVTWIFISDGVFDVAMSISGRLEPLYHSSIIGLTNVEISSFASIFHATMMVLLPLGGWFADKAGERAGIVVGHLFFVFGALIFLFGNAYIHFAVVSILYGIGGSLMSPSYNSLISKVVPPNMRGVAYGLFATSLGLISLPAPYIGGIMWQMLGPKAPFFVPLIAGLVVTPLLWFKLGQAIKDTDS
ncbi:MAG: MFS transporter [Firmicutes bacterium]|jgi:MFS family permease|nr:MFS transporter [Bacillota bacterium]